MKTARNSVLRVAALACLGMTASFMAHTTAQEHSGDAGILDKATAERAFPSKPPYSPYAGRKYPSRPLWGDTHLHTSVSFDAVAFGCRVGPEEAFRFARGEEVTSSTGLRVKLSVPLDFLVVADHAESFGVMGDILDGNPMLMGDPDCRRWHEMLKKGGESALEVYKEMVARGSGQGKPLPVILGDKQFIRSVWERQTAWAEKYNEPGQFTAMIGYEWSSTDKGNNLHRNVLYRDGKAKADLALPLAAEGANQDPEKLWQWMAAYEDKTGGQVLAIPHNGNLSNGRMFALADFMGNPLTQKYVETRAQWEPVVEITQQKGDGETHPYLSPNDEFADFERWDAGNLGGPEKKTKSMFEFEYVRSALKNGLKLEREFGVNPFKFGVVGSTDAHTGLAAVQEDNFFGKLPHMEPSDHRAKGVVMDFGPGKPKTMGWQLVSSGYAAVWANENTRESIWDAIKRKEVYGTTGSRMIVRFFGGWDFTPADANSRMPAKTGYAKGVPMGGDLQQAPPGKSPTFLVAALKDPLGANLDRIQIIKGWLDAKGEVQEQVYDVVWGDADKRQPGADGKVPPVGNTVDVANATWSNTIGDPELIAVWKDPNFDASLKAFYYVRVIEIPTPRWTAYDAKYYGLKLPKEVPMIATERGYTSPIWYTP